MFDPVDWAEIFLPSIPILELVVRATVMFLAIFVLMRITPQRQASGMNVSDLIVIVVIADVASPGLIGTEAMAIGDGIISVVVVLFWSFATNWVAYRVPAIDKFSYPRPILLVTDGVLDRRAMRKEMITEEELRTSMRTEGLDGFDKIKRAHLEGDGSISIVPVDGA